MKTNLKLNFHVAFYTTTSKNVLSGRNYEGNSIIEAIEKFNADDNTPSMSMIKYVSIEENMTKSEIKEIRIEKT
jgi:hypothetical protein